MNHQPRLTNGQPFGPYKVLAHLGSGGMGEVYLALDGRLNRKVALKLLPSSFAEAGERLRRFEQEASAVSSINHPNILTIYEVGEVDLVRFIATEFIDGETLRKIVAGGPMSLSRATGIGVQISAALTAAHDAGVIHRDIKPENIMIRRDGYVKVLDFGIAKLNERNEQTDLDAATKVKTNAGMRLGTVSYMSPEQARGHEVDARADIWSLGVILYEMTSGRMPFHGVTINHVLVAIQDHEPAPLPQAADEFANEFERIVFKALAKDRHARYQTAGEVFDDLKKLEQEIEFKSKLTHSAMVQLSAGPALSRTPAAQEGSLSSLPVRLTPLIGRAADVNAIIKQLGSESVRLMTLTGPGGTGKTRLALQVATELLGKFRDGVIFVELAAVVDPNQVALAIAQTVGLKESGKSPNESLKEFLRDRELLLVIDNFEQVEASAPLIAELLNSAPRLKALVTSRAALRISGEHEFKVSPLPVPAGHQTFSVEAVARFPAIELFIQRAKAVKPGFALTSENAEAIVQICSTLDGLPLAIELAAARIKVLPPRALLSRLKDRLKLLVGGARDLPLRQQTMRGAIAWSCDLLDETEQKLFRRLSVFVGGCDLEAIEAVCNSGDLDSGILDVLSSLVDKSLLEQSEAHAEPRFRILETIADFGREQLITIKEAEDLHRAHAAFFVKLAEKCETALLGTQQEACLDKLELEHGNFYSAILWAESNQQAEIGLRLAGAIWRFWEMRGYLAEGQNILRRLLAFDPTPETMKPRLKALYAAGILADSLGDYQAARGYFSQQLALHKQSGDKWGVANSINNLGIIALRQRDYASAHTLYEETLNCWRELGNQRAVALALGNLGNVADLIGDYEVAKIYYQESLVLFETMQDSRGVALSLHHLGDIARRQNEHEQARALYDRGLRILIELGDRRAMANLLTDMGNMEGERGDFATARRLHEESMVIFSELGDVRGIANLLEAIMRIAVARGQLERALRLAGGASRLREDFQAPLPPDEAIELKQSLVSVRRQLGAASSDLAWQDGWAMRAEKAIQFALAAETDRVA